MPKSSRAEKQEEQTQRILLVEDELVQREFYHRALNPLGLSVHDVATAEEALRVLSQNSYHLALIDLSLPGMKGDELVRRIRKRISKSLPLVILTGYGSIESCKELLMAGADDYLTKPCDIDVLREVISRFLGAKATASVSLVNDAPSNLSLSAREWDVLRLLRDGLEDKEIAARLKISVRTVNTHIENLFLKLSCTNRTELVALSFRHDLRAH